MGSTILVLVDGSSRQNCYHPEHGYSFSIVGVQNWTI